MVDKSLKRTFEQRLSAASQVLEPKLDGRLRDRRSGRFRKGRSD
jgi:hypothetical protein